MCSSDLDDRIVELEALQEANDKVVLGYCSRITKLEAALKECADDLEEEIDARYDGTRHLTSQQRKWERDMETVNAARAALEGKTDD